MREAKRIIRALLIQPPAEGGVHSLLPHISRYSEGIGFKPPLGLLYLATTLKQFSGHEVKVIDAIAQRKSISDAVEEAVRYRPDIIGISAWTDFWYSAYQIGKMAKEALPGSHIVYGGPHVGIFPEETLSLPFVDSIVAGDGEMPFLSLCNMMADRYFKNDVPGLHLKSFGLKKGEQSCFNQEDINNLPIPDRTLLPINLYSSLLGKNKSSTTMITSRGCPYRCTFCRLSFQGCICRSAENVVSEFMQIEKLGIKEVEVYDDTFTWSKKRVIDICDGLIKKGVHIRWSLRDRVNLADEEILRHLFKAGCRRVHYGIESGVDRVLERMRKGITVEQARQAVELAKKIGMTVLGYFMFGNLDETVEDMRKTQELALSLPLDYAEFSVTIPYPGTAIYDELLKSNIIKSDYWRGYARNPSADFIIPKVVEQNADLKMLISLCNETVRKFYFRPKYIACQIKHIRNRSEFVKKYKMGLHLLNQAITGGRR